MSCASPNHLHWEDLRSKPAEEVLARGGVKPASEGFGYKVEFLDAVYQVDPIAQRIWELGPDPQRVLTEEFQILLIRYLVAPLGGPLEGKAISEKDLPGGVTFFQGPHALYVKPIAKRYGAAPQAFEARGRELSAEPVDHGDKAMRFFPFPQIPVTYVLWKEDEEFPASVSILLDSSIERWFELDMVFTLVWVLTDRICERRDGAR